MKTNKRVNTPAPRTREGGIADRTSAAQELKRSVLSNLLWEGEFYEDGVTNAQRVAELIPKVAPSTVAELAVQARTDMNLRHMPLHITREMLRHERHKDLVDSVIPQVVLRADEMGELLALYWRDGRQPLAKKLKKGLAKTFWNFNEYQFGKYNRKQDAVKIKDVLRMVHPVPHTEEEKALFEAIMTDSLKTPDTWEVALSSGKDKRVAWTRLLSEGKLGSLALLRNLRNMKQAGVNEDLIREKLVNSNHSRTLPFRFISAARAIPEFEGMIEEAMLKALEGAPRLPGKTVFLIDISPSMDWRISNKSDLNRIDVATALAAIGNEVADESRIYSFSRDLNQVPQNRRGFALMDKINNSGVKNGSYLWTAVKGIREREIYDRLIVITDEQAHDSPTSDDLKLGGAQGYMINVASNKNGLGYRGNWTNIDGWSEAVFRYIDEIEKLELP